MIVLSAVWRSASIKKGRKTPPPHGTTIGKCITHTGPRVGVFLFPVHSFYPGLHSNGGMFLSGISSRPRRQFHLAAGYMPAP